MADCLFDCFRAIVLVLGFGYAARQDRKTWMWAESVMCGVYATALFVCPSMLFPNTDSASLFFLVRVFASFIMAGSYGVYLIRGTRDEDVIGACLWSRMAGITACLFAMGYAYSQKSELFPDKTLYFDGVTFMLVLLTSAYQMWRGGYRTGGREQRDVISVICRVFFLVSFLAGVSHLAYPSWVFFKKPEALETVMIRGIGAMVFGGSFMWWYSTSFRDDADRSACFKWGIVNTALNFLAMCLGYFRDGAFGQQEFLAMHVGLIPGAVASLALYMLWRKNADNNSSSSYYLRSKSQ